MNDGELRLSGSTVDKLFAFHLRWNASGQLICISTLLRKYWDLEDDISLESVNLSMHRPFRGSLESKLFAELTRISVDVGAGDECRIFRGEIFQLDGDQGWMLVGVPLISTVDELRRTGLVMGDLPKHLGLGDLLISNEAVQVAQQASEEATREVEQRNERLSASLHEKEILLKEIHHRVKNNLQLISSLLMLQANKMPSEAAKELLQDSIQRIRSMALIHQQLYGVDSLAKIDLGVYARTLAQSLASLSRPGARMHVESEPVWVTVEAAVPIGLILNELVTNALKYGISPQQSEGGRTGEHCDVLIEVGLQEGQIRIAVLDSGEGLPEGFDPLRSKGLGMQLVRALTRQIRGKVDFDVDRGTRFVMTCPVEGEDNIASDEVATE